MAGLNPLQRQLREINQDARIAAAAAVLDVFDQAMTHRSLFKALKEPPLDVLEAYRISMLALYEALDTIAQRAIDLDRSDRASF